MLRSFKLSRFMKRDESLNELINNSLYLNSLLGLEKSEKLI